MKERIFAVCIFLIIVGFVATNTIVLEKTTDILTEEIKAISVKSDEAIDDVSRIIDVFKSKERFFGLSVSHDDLTNIEDCFAELRGSLSIGDTDSAEIVKHRLISFLEHLRRLVGLNIDTII